MALYGTLASLSQTAASNAADGSVDAPSTIDQQTNLLASFIAQLRDGNGFSYGVNRIGNCRLTKSGANLVLSRLNGDGLTINGLVYSIPSGGVSLAPTALTPSANYYIYAYMSGATMTLEASLTTHATDTATGMEIKSGDASRTLVGLARTIAGPAWSDTSNARLVISWFNRRPRQCLAGLGASVGTSSAAAAELTNALRCEFVTWGEHAMFAFDGYASNSTLGATVATYLSLDGTTLQDAYSVFLNTGANQIGPVALSAAIDLSEGNHYVTPFVSVNTGTGTWIGNGSAGVRCSMKGLIQG
jgi:hypothetical protein